MLYPLMIQSLAADQIEQARRDAVRTRLIRQARARARHAPADRGARRARRSPLLVTLRAAGPATRLPR